MLKNWKVFSHSNEISQANAKSDCTLFTLSVINLWTESVNIWKCKFRPIWSFPSSFRFLHMQQVKVTENFFKKWFKVNSDLETSTISFPLQGPLNQIVGKKFEKWKNLSGSGEPAGLAGADALLASGQDAGNAVGLGQQCGVHHGEAESGQNARQWAVELVRNGQQGESCQVAEGHSGQDDVRQLAGRGFDDRRLVVTSEDGGRYHGNQQADDGQRDSSDGLLVAPLDVLHRNLHATCRSIQRD